MEILENFEQLKLTLREKWLDYYKNNLPLFNTIDINDFDMGKNLYRPNGSVILSVVILLLPEIKDYIQIMANVNPDKEKIVELLGLNFSPKVELENTNE